MINIIGNDEKKNFRFSVYLSTVEYTFFSYQSPFFFSPGLLNNNNNEYLTLFVLIVSLAFVPYKRNRTRSSIYNTYDNTIDGIPRHTSTGTTMHNDQSKRQLTFIFHRNHAQPTDDFLIIDDDNRHDIKY